MAFAENTSVSEERSRAEIETVLKKYGADLRTTLSTSPSKWERLRRTVEKLGRKDGKKNRTRLRSSPVTIDLKKLEEVAKKATPGPWRINDAGPNSGNVIRIEVVAADGFKICDIEDSMVSHNYRSTTKAIRAQNRDLANAQLIVASSSVLLVLIQRIREQETELRAAREVTAALPKTADGQPLYRGRKVWFLNTSGNPYSIEVPEKMGDGWDESYSTPGAALAAKGAAQ